ncbi:MAG: hypothetical protein KDK05_33130 [Candidatus Competibacteraceae bacterium]|nr:hypothetical protein [Candidatus Competibacteraceae bacterium]
MLQKILSAAGIIGNAWTLGRCPNWWGGFDPRVAAAGKNRIRPCTNKYRPHQGPRECERRRSRRRVQQ